MRCKKKCHTQNPTKQTHFHNYSKEEKREREEIKVTSVVAGPPLFFCFLFCFFSLQREGIEHFVEGQADVVVDHMIERPHTDLLPIAPPQHQIVLPRGRLTLKRERERKRKKKC